MPFLFNFLDPDEGTRDEQCVQEKTDKNGSLESLEKCQEVFQITDEDPEKPFIVYDIGNDLCIKCLDSREVEKSLCRSKSEKYGVVRAAESHSDLIPNVYEGGLKVWECAVDLVTYLNDNMVNFQDCRVLDLGCGAGLPGILAALKGAKDVHFQDYNPEVLQYYTIPNVNSNVNDTDEIEMATAKQKCGCRYFSGDWTSFSSHIGKEGIRYDVILSAETIYKPDNYRKLTHVFNEHLSDDGTIYLAAKSNYFGVGGGTSTFKAFLDTEGVFQVHDSFVVEGDIPRDILILKRKGTRKKRKHEDE